MPALVRMRRTVGRLRSMPSRSRNNSVKWLWACPGVAVAGQLHHGSGGRLRDGVVRSSAPVPMGQCSGTVLAISGEETLGVAFTHSHDPGSLGDGKLVFQNAVEYLNPCLFLLVQRYIPHRDDMFADQLAGDRIVNSNKNILISRPYSAISGHSAAQSQALAPVVALKRGCSDGHGLGSNPVGSGAPSKNVPSCP